MTKLNTQHQLTSKKLKQELKVERLPEGRVSYCMASKSSDSGLFSNDRFLIINEIDESVGYLNEAPSKLPFEEKGRVVKPKKEAKISKVKLKTKKGTNVIEFECFEVENKGQKIKEFWEFTFTSPKLTEDVLTQINYIKDSITKAERQRRIQTELKLVPKDPKNQPKNQVSINAPITASKLDTTEKDKQGLMQKIEKNNQQQQQQKNEDINEEFSNKKHITIVPESIKQKPFNKFRTEVKESGTLIDKLSVRNSSASNEKQKSKLSESRYLKDNNQEFKLSEKSEQSFVEHSSIKKDFIKKGSNKQSLLNSNMDEHRYQFAMRMSQQSLKHPRSSIRSLQAEMGGKEDWNALFYTSANRLETVLRFKEKCVKLMTAIIDQLSFPQSERLLQPIQKSSQIQIYEIQNIVCELGFVVDNQRLAPRRLKNEFRNYLYIIESTKNRLKIKVPLCCLIEYKGIVGLAKAHIVNGKPIDYSYVIEQLVQLESATKIKKQVLLNETNGNILIADIQNQQYLFLECLYGYIPFDANAGRKDSQLRMEVLATLTKSVAGGYLDPEDRESQDAIIELSRNVKAYSLELLSMLENMELTILNTIELKRYLYVNGINTRYLETMYKSSKIILVRKIVLSEICSRIAAKIMRVELQQEIKAVSLMRKHEDTLLMNQALLQWIFRMLDNIVSANEGSADIWKNIFHQAKKKYKIEFTKDDLAIGYFMSSLFKKVNVKLNMNYFTKQKEYFKQKHTLRSELIEELGISCDSFPMRFDPTISKIYDILNAQPNHDGFTNLQILLQNGTVDRFVSDCGLQQRTRVYLANFVPKDSLQHNFKIYESTDQQPPTLHSIQTLIFELKWEIRSANISRIINRFELATELVSFWGEQNHPLLVQIFEIMCQFHNSQGEFEEAITLAKSSLVNCIKTVGTNHTLTATRYSYLANIFYKLERKEESLVQYSRARDIYINNNLKQYEYAVVCVRLANLCLNMDKVTESLVRAMEALKIFQQSTSCQSELLEVYELLQRIYEINNQHAQLYTLSILCSKRLNNTKSRKVMVKMLRLCLYPYFTDLKPSEVAIIQNIVGQLQLQNQTGWEYIERRAKQENIVTALTAKLQKLDALWTEIAQRNMLKSFKPLNSSDGQDFLILFQSIVQLIGLNFLLGCMTKI